MHCNYTHKIIYWSRPPHITSVHNRKMFTVYASNIYLKYANGDTEKKIFFLRTFGVFLALPRTFPWTSDHHHGDGGL